MTPTMPGRPPLTAPSVNLRLRRWAYDGRRAGLNGLPGDLPLGDGERPEAGQGGDDVVDQAGSCRRADGQPEHPNAGQPLGPDVAGSVDEVSRSAVPAGDLDAPAGVGGTGRGE